MWLSRGVCLCVFGVASVASSLSAAESVTVELWNDNPMEAMAELNGHLPADERVVWHADPALSPSTWPGVTATLNGEPADIIRGYAEAAGLAVTAHADGYWLHWPAGDHIEDLSGLSPHELRQAHHPKALAQLIIMGAAAGTPAREALAAALGFSRREQRSKRGGGLVIFGNPNARLQRTAALDSRRGQLPRTVAGCSNCTAGPGCVVCGGGRDCCQREPCC